MARKAAQAIRNDRFGSGDRASMSNLLRLRVATSRHHAEYYSADDHAYHHCTAKVYILVITCPAIQQDCKRYAAALRCRYALSTQLFIRVSTDNTTS